MLNNKKEGLNFLQAEMLYSAFISKCLQDLKSEAVLCGELASVEITIGRYTRKFPVADVMDDKMLYDLLSNLSEIYRKKFEYYRGRIKEINDGNKDKV